MLTDVGCFIDSPKKKFFYFAVVLAISFCGLRAKELFAAGPVVSTPKKAKQKDVTEQAKVFDGTAQTSMNYRVQVQWQMLRSRAHSSLAGTTTESYQVEWTLSIRGASAIVMTPHEKFELPWVISSRDPKAGTLQLTRGELARLLGIEQELPQDSRLWQAEDPATLIVQAYEGRQFDPVFRYVDDNGMVMIRLLARVATKK